MKILLEKLLNSIKIVIYYQLKKGIGILDTKN